MYECMYSKTNLYSYYGFHKNKAVTGPILCIEDALKSHAVRGRGIFA